MLSVSSVLWIYWYKRGRSIGILNDKNSLKLLLEDKVIVPTEVWEQESAV